MRLGALGACLLVFVLAGCNRSSDPGAGKTSKNSTPSDKVSGAKGSPNKLPAGKLQSVTLQLNWFPEVEHGGFYAAATEGYFADAGLDVTILAGGPETPVVGQVASGHADLGVANADGLLLGCAQQAPIVALMAPLQTSPRCILVHESTGIKDLEGLADLTLAISDGAAFSHFLRKRVSLPNVKIVPYGGNVQQFLTDEKFAQQGYVFSEPIVARRKGAKPRVLMLAELGFNPYTSVLFASEEFLKEQPEAARKMVRASVRGWQDYVGDDHVAQRANARILSENQEMDEEILREGRLALRDLVLAGLDAPTDIGKMTRERWNELAAQLIETELMKADAVQVDSVFDVNYLRRKKER